MCRLPTIVWWGIGNVQSMWNTINSTRKKLELLLLLSNCYHKTTHCALHTQERPRHVSLSAQRKMTEFPFHAPTEPQTTRIKFQQDTKHQNQKSKIIKKKNSKFPIPNAPTNTRWLHFSTIMNMYYIQNVQNLKLLFFFSTTQCGMFKIY